MPPIEPKQPDQERIVASLANECHVPMGEMTVLYEHERAALASGAHVTNFLHILAARKVLELLRRRERDKQTLTVGPPALIPV